MATKIEWVQNKKSLFIDKHKPAAKQTPLVPEAADNMVI